MALLAAIGRAFTDSDGNAGGLPQARQPSQVSTYQDRSVLSICLCSQLRSSLFYPFSTFGWSLSLFRPQWPYRNCVHSIRRHPIKTRIRHQRSLGIRPPPAPFQRALCRVHHYLPDHYPATLLQYLKSVRTSLTSSPRDLACTCQCSKPKRTPIIIPRQTFPSLLAPLESRGEEL